MHPTCSTHRDAAADRRNEDLAFPKYRVYVARSAYRLATHPGRFTGDSGYLVHKLLMLGRLNVARPSAGEFFRQVRAETNKVTWPSRAETVQTTIMVMIMASILALFFFGVDSIIGASVKALLSLVK